MSAAMFQGYEMRNLCIAFFALFSSSTVSAAEIETSNFNALFATTCMQYFYSQEDLRKEMPGQSAEVLPAEQSEFFLGGQPGTAWILVVSGAKYVVSLRDDTLCAVFAQRAESAAVQTGFSSLVGSAPEPLIATKLDDLALGPNNRSTRTIAYSWGRPKDDSELVFTLTTSDDVDATVQAMASMALVKKPN
jgi:hypothetical protein